MPLLNDMQEESFLERIANSFYSRSTCLLATCIWMERPMPLLNDMQEESTYN
jgi:hypothetical protein